MIKYAQKLGVHDVNEQGLWGVSAGQYVHHVFHVNDVSEDAGAIPRIRSPPAGRTTTRRLMCWWDLQLGRVVPPRPSLMLHGGRRWFPPAAPLTFDRTIGKSCRSVPGYGVTLGRCDSRRHVHVNDSNRQSWRVVYTAG